MSILVKQNAKDIKLDESGELFNSFVEYIDFTRFLVQCYDTMIIKGIPKIITSTVLKTDISTIHFKNVIFQPAGNIDDPNTYPTMHRLRETSYVASGYVDIVERFRDGTEEVEVRIPFGQIPAMMGSCVCITRNLDSYQRHLIGENENDPDGYFIIKGNERFVLIQEKLRMNKILMYNKDNKGNFLCTFTCITMTGSQVVNIIMGKSFGFKLHLRTFGQGKHVPVLLIYRLFGYESKDEILGHILKFTNPENHTKIIHALGPSVFKFETTGDVYKYIHRKSTDSVKINESSWENNKKKLHDDIIEDLFPTMKDEPFMRKLDMFAMMIVRIAEYKAGITKMDDRDSWANKRIETSARFMETLFREIWEKIIKSTQEKLSSEKIRENGIGTHLTSVRKYLTTDTVKDDFNSSFKSTYWGLKTGKSALPVSRYKQNMTDILKRDSHMAAVSHLRRITAPTNKQTKHSAVRLVHWSSLHYICPAETPEGSSCGLVKNMAMSCWVSIERDEAPIREYLKSRTCENVDKENPIKLLVNGTFIGWTNRDTYQYMRNLKLNGGIYFDTCIVQENNFLYIFTDSSRPMSPELVVKDGKLVLDQLMDEEYERTGRRKIPHFSDLINQGAVEFIDASEQSFIILAYSRDHLDQMVKSGIKVTHCDIDAITMLSVSSGIIPFAHKSQAPRNTYQASMGKQALGQYHTNHKLRYDTTAKVLAYPKRPIFESQVNKVVGLNRQPAGEMVTIALLTYGGWEQEDAIVINRSSRDRGMFLTTKYFTKTTTISKDSTKDYKEYFGVPDNKKNIADKYRNLDSKGMPILNSYVKRGDCIIGKIRMSANEQKDVSIYLGVGECGLIDRVTIIQNTNISNLITIKVKIRELRVEVVGDKYASRYAQKATIGKIASDDDFPFTDKGNRPDIIINPLPIPGRMTINKVSEIIGSKASTLKGEFVNATTFRNYPEDEYAKLLEDNGYDFSGEETMYDGITGKKIQAKIFIGPCYYQVLRHQVRDKDQVRGLGLAKMTTRQPTCGRHEGGALRLGNMERDALISHGASAMLLDRMCYFSDPFNLVLCTSCGDMAIANYPEVSSFTCKGCHGNSFGKVTTSYVFKYLVHILAAASINVKILTTVIEDTPRQNEESDIEEDVVSIMSDDDSETESNKEKDENKKDSDEEEEEEEEETISDEEDGYDEDI